MENPFGMSEIHPNPPLPRRGFDKTTNSQDGYEFPLIKGGGGGFFLETRRAELSPVVRACADRLRSSIHEICLKYGVSDPAGLFAKIAQGTTSGLRTGELLKDAKDLKNYQDGLEHILLNKTLPEGELEAQGFFQIRNVPLFAEGLPSSDCLRDTYGIDEIWAEDYFQGRQMSDFKTTEQDLLAMGVEDPETRKGILRGMEDGWSAAANRWFKIIDLSGKPAEATKDVLDIIDKTGCRPVNLAEVLAYAKSHHSGLLNPHEIVSQVCALGTSFSDPQGTRYVPHLIWEGKKRYLYGTEIRKSWLGRSKLLVVRR